MRSFFLVLLVSTSSHAEEPAVTGEFIRDPYAHARALLEPTAQAGEKARGHEQSLKIRQIPERWLRATADLDGDGVADIVIGRGLNRGARTLLFVKHGTGYLLSGELETPANCLFVEEGSTNGLRDLHTFVSMKGRVRFAFDGRRYVPAGQDNNDTLCKTNLSLELSADMKRWAPLKLIANVRG